MSLAHSIASRKRWKNISPEERSKRMSRIATERQAQMTLKERKKWSKVMIEAKLKK